MRERERAVFELLNLPVPSRDNDDVGHVDDPDFDAARAQVDQSAGGPS